MSDDAAAVGSIIRDARKRRGWSQRHLAERVGVQQQSVAKWENGTTLPRAVTMAQLGKALGLDQSALLEAAGYLPGPRDLPTSSETDAEDFDDDEIELDFNSAMEHVPDEVRQAVIRIVKPYLEES